MGKVRHRALRSSGPSLQKNRYSLDFILQLASMEFLYGNHSETATQRR
jgi:hypothetical protein